MVRNVDIRNFNLKNDENKNILPQHGSLAIKNMVKILITHRNYMYC